ncbi:cobalamin biosynthesis protein P47K [Telmatocola sphagniphila]|uniref:Cobalamin biosynthesis protein P47K n=2 Tax=Telmatocola sphagniphila TaxID=1123043 RepID=A0A8E6BBW7_9BACT|nr:cobalamin biosynthesis protein P47K [Telmatocola sphagniphila]
MIGGFLGAGKTTTLARLARYYMDRGQKVGLVTNDQAQNLVDTNSLRSQGFDVSEVAGACFCCRFDDLVNRVTQLQDDSRPEIILAEPVGSCTDLVATVIQPLKDLYKGRFEVAPYAVLFKPSHGLKILRNESSGFSPKAAYIFRKQLEEADALVINRMDEIQPARLAELEKLLNTEFPGVPVLAISAKTGQGFDALPELLDQQGAFGKKILDIDYDIYAEGEAEMGWLNSSVHLVAERPTEMDPLLMEVIVQLQDRIRTLGGEVAHLKVIGMEEGGAFGVANLVSSAGQPEFSLPSNSLFQVADLIINARVAIDPEALQKEVEKVVAQSALSRNLQTEFRQIQSLRPGRPVPIHRYSEIV